MAAHLPTIEPESSMKIGEMMMDMASRALVCW
jgi:hypothetical protein